MLIRCCLMALTAADTPGITRSRHTVTAILEPWSRHCAQAAPSCTLKTCRTALGGPFIGTKTAHNQLLLQPTPAVTTYLQVQCVHIEYVLQGVAVVRKDVAPEQAQGRDQQDKHRRQTTAQHVGVSATVNVGDLGSNNPLIINKPGW